MYEWRKKEEKRELTDETGMDTQGHGHADGCVSVWTQMCCVWIQMSRKEKEKKYFVNADGGHVGLRKCCVWMWMSKKERKKKKRKKLTLVRMIG